jgi:HNH endonuclease
MTKLHNKSQWHRRARRQLQKAPLCAMCLAEGKIVAAKIADHIVPHHGDAVEFWRGKLQSLCAHCHESRKKFQEQRGFDQHNRHRWLADRSAASGLSEYEILKQTRKIECDASLWLFES